MDWEKLISKRTQIPREAEPRFWEDYPISDFEKDYKSIISSAAFRRLQDKTQVFPLDQSDFVRTRLTHSIEVSTIAKQLGIMITQNKTPYLPLEFAENSALQHDIPSILSCSGLLHDLGNPPFGHFGEVVIGEWFQRTLERDTFQFKGTPVRDLLNQQMKQDLCYFEGNAQALRILSKARWNSGGSDANLTYAVINTLIKYPTSSIDVDAGSEDVRVHKLGFFLSEQPMFEAIRNEVGLCEEGVPSHVRYPLTFLMEAADDIAYATSDLEDGLKKGMFSVDEFCKYAQDCIEKLPQGTKRSRTAELFGKLEAGLAEIPSRNAESDMVVFQKWIEYVKRWFMYVVAYSFSKNYAKIMDGTYHDDMFAEGYHTHSVKILKGAMVEFVFSAPGILKLELSARKIIASLLGDFIPAVLYWGDEEGPYRMSKADKKFVNIISDNLKRDYQQAKGEDPIYNLYLRFLMVTDYISGMTDSFAKKLYQELNGIC